MWFIGVMHFQMGDFLTIESCNFIKEFVQSCGSFGSCKTQLSVVWLNQHNIFLEMGVMWIMEVNISINYASVWFFPLGCYIPQSRVLKRSTPSTLYVRTKLKQVYCFSELGFTRLTYLKEMSDVVSTFEMTFLCSNASRYYIYTITALP